MVKTVATISSEAFSRLAISPTVQIPDWLLYAPWLSREESKSQSVGQQILHGEHWSHHQDRRC